MCIWACIGRKVVIDPLLARPIDSGPKVVLSQPFHLNKADTSHARNTAAFR